MKNNVALRYVRICISRSLQEFLLPFSLLPSLCFISFILVPVLSYFFFLLSRLRLPRLPFSISPLVCLCSSLFLLFLHNPPPFSAFLLTPPRSSRLLLVSFRPSFFQFVWPRSSSFLLNPPRFSPLVIDLTRSSSVLLVPRFPSLLVSSRSSSILLNSTSIPLPPSRSSPLLFVSPYWISILVAPPPSLLSLQATFFSWPFCFILVPYHWSSSLLALSVPISFFLDSSGSFLSYSFLLDSSGSFSFLLVSPWFFWLFFVPLRFSSFLLATQCFSSLLLSFLRSLPFLPIPPGFRSFVLVPSRSSSFLLTFPRSSSLIFITFGSFSFLLLSPRCFLFILTLLLSFSFLVVPYCSSYSSFPHMSISDKPLLPQIPHEHV